MIYADDLGYGDVQNYNPERGKIPTPNIDRLAAEGMRFTDAHSSSGVCSPSRYTLLTGRYHWRSRLQRGIVSLWGEPLIPADRMTLASLAKKAGYRTGCIGKWHLGWSWPIADAQKKWFNSTGYGGKKDLLATDDHRRVWAEVFAKPIPGGPLAVGFDTYFGTDVPNWPPYCFIADDQTVGIPSEYADPRLFARNQASQQGPAIEGWTLEPILPAIVDRAIEFVSEDASEPFFLYLPLTSPHTPLSVNAEWRDKSGLNLYADFVMETDAEIGRLLDALDECGRAPNTLVLFTSDNGCAPYIGAQELERQGHYPSGPLRGYKSDAWEGGHRVPFIVRWPGQVAEGTTCSQLVHQADWMATMAGLFDSRLPENAGEDSFNLLPLLQGNDEPIRDTAVSCSSSGVPAFRHHQWKYIPAPGSGGWSKSPVGETLQPCQLYHLESDLGETENLANREEQRVQAMSEMFEQLIVRGRSNAGPAQTNDVPVIRYPKSQPK